MTALQTIPAQDGPMFKGLDAPFLRRTAVAALVALALVALNAAVYFDRAWAGRYLFAGVWTLLFLGLTPLILKELLFAPQRLLRAFGLVGVKLALIAVMIAACLYWTRPGAATPAGFGSSLAAGVSTPLVVLVLRAIGSQMKSAGQQHD